MEEKTNLIKKNERMRSVVVYAPDVSNLRNESRHHLNNKGENVRL